MSRHKYDSADAPGWRWLAWRQGSRMVELYVEPMHRRVTRRFFERRPELRECDLAAPAPKIPDPMA